MKIHKIEVFVLDFEDVGAEECETIIENVRYLSIRTGDIMSLDIGEWSDDHPANKSDVNISQYFNERKLEETLKLSSYAIMKNSVE